MMLGGIGAAECHTGKLASTVEECVAFSCYFSYRGSTQDLRRPQATCLPFVVIFIAVDLPRMLLLLLLPVLLLLLLLRYYFYFY